MLEVLSRPLPKQQIGRLLIVDLCVILVLLLLPVRTSWNGYREARTKLRQQEMLKEDYTSRLGRAQQAVQQEPILLGEIRAAMALLSEGKRRLRPPADAATILEELRDLILGRRLDLLNISQPDSREQTGFEERLMVISVQGSFSELVQFLHALRHRETYMVVDRMILQVAEPDDRRPVLTMEASLRTILVEDITPFSQIMSILADSTVTLPVSLQQEPPSSREDGASTSEERDE